MASALPQNRTALGSDALAAYYQRVRDASLVLSSSLSPEDQVVQTIPEVSPTKWHLAHVTWFFEQFCLTKHACEYQCFHERYDYLFNSYYRTVGEMHARPDRGLLSRPTVAQITAFREHVDAAMLRLIEERGDDPQFAFLVTLGLHHEQQHQELLLTDIKQVLFVNPLGPAYRSQLPVTTGRSTALQFAERQGGIFEIGWDGTGFCFDNETPRHRVILEDHAIGNRLVTNAEYRQFIDDHAYSNPALWLSDGWAVIRERNWDRPLCWSEDLNDEFTLGGWRSIDSNAPVCHVSFYEADAFARWAGARLPTEAEWELAAGVTTAHGNFLDSGVLQPTGLEPASSPSEPMGQLWGDVWEWTASSYSAYSRFKPLAGSLGEYNGKFMCNQMVVRGGSCVSWKEHIRASYRSFFYPHDRWQFLGFRLAKDS